MTINLLHLTDIHFGQSLMTSSWPMIKAELLRDLDWVIEEAGPIDLIALTGDVAFSGAATEYRQADNFLEDLGLHILDRSGLLPSLAAVPGNHDLQRPPRKSLAAQVLAQLWTPAIEDDLLTDQSGELCAFVKEVFAEYTNWAERRVLPSLPDETKGILPGDFSASLRKNDKSVGIVALNSSFRHLSGEVVEGGLTVAGRQIQAACGGDLPSWTREHDVTLALTHHPSTWLEPTGDFTSSLFAPTTSVRLHLCGHMHAERYGMQSVGSEAPYVVHQGMSLFGLERYGAGAGDVDRRHGYALLSLDVTDDNVGVRVWPRRATNDAGYWSLDRDSSFGLEKGKAVSRSLALRLPQSTSVAKGPNSERGIATAVSAPLPANENASDSAVQAALAQLSTGDLVVVVGDRLPSEDFESDTQAGGLSQCEIVRSEIWNALYPGIPDDSSQPWKELVELAVSQTPDALEILLQSYLRSASALRMRDTALILGAPWTRLFYLSPEDDFWTAAANADRSDSTPRIDGIRAPFRLPLPGVTPAIQLSGRYLGNRATEVEWEPAGQQLDGPVVEWRRFATRLIPRSPTLFLADSMRSLSFWQYLTSRGTTSDSLRPPAFLVTASLSPHQAAVLPLYGVQWIRSDVASFVRKYLVSGRQEHADGLRRIAARRLEKPTNVLTVAGLRSQATAGSRDYLYGREPSWGDIIDGYAATLHALGELRQKLVDGGDRIHIVSGTAGAGRTSLLMRLALELDASHLRVGWIDRATTAKIEEIVETVRRENLDAVILDDPDIFGAEAAHFLERLHDGGSRLVCAGVRSVRTHLLTSAAKATVWNIPNLNLDDIDAVAAKLRKFRALADRRMLRPDLVSLFRDEAAHQLLVGMIRATSGLSLSGKVESECMQLSAEQLKMYGCLSLVTTEREEMTREEVMEATNGGTASSRTLDSLLRAKLVIENQTGLYSVRHRVIAESVLHYLRAHGQLREVVQDCLWTYAALAADLRDPTRRERRIMIRLLSHTYLIALGLTPVDIRSIYDYVEASLDADFHYWLQRGSFELEAGDKSIALHDLRRAMTTEGGEDDPYVLTELSYLRFRLAEGNKSAEGLAWGLSGFQDVRKVILRSGEKSPHTFVVLARYGVPWLISASLPRSEHLELMREASRLLRLGSRLDRLNARVAEARGKGIDMLAAAIEAVESGRA